MDDVSDFFKSGFLSLHKNKIGKNYQQKTLKDRMDNFNNIRRETRNTIMFQKRNINENMTPINTPETSKFVKKAIEKKGEKKVNKRLEMLNKWKAEKEKKKNEEKQKTKPLFKVCHVPIEVGLPNLEKVNKEIKGKAISQFAPPNHKFHAPKNLKPISFSSSTINNSPVVSNSKSTKKTNLTEKTFRQNSSVSQINMRATRSRADDLVKLKKRDIVSQSRSSKADANMKNTLKKTTDNAKLSISPKRGRSNVQQKHSNRKQILAPNQRCPTNKKTEIKDKSSVVSSTSIVAKRSPPKKSKQTETHTKHENVNLRKKYVFNKDNETREINNSKNGTPAITIRKTPKQNKIKFEVDNSAVGKCENQLNETEKLQQKIKNRPITTPRKSRRSTGNTLKKSVEWNVIDVVDSDEEIISKDINDRTPKIAVRTYKKTPKRSKKTLSSDDDKETDETLVPQGQSSPETPKNNKSASPVYISPFVTVSRGKTSARKEYLVRQSPGSVPDSSNFNKSISNNVSPKAGAEYFSKKLIIEITRIESLCKEWNVYKEENNIPEEGKDMIDVAIGQSNLLISKKFQQFKGLIEQCRSYEYLEKPITCKDLHGFWDMIYMQVEDLDKRFKKLSDLKVNNWEEIIPEKKLVVKRGRGRPKKSTATSSLKNLIKAAREKKKSDEDVDQNHLLTLQTDAKVFAGGYYSVKSPVIEHSIPYQASAIRSSSTRRSLRVSLLAHQTKKRISSPGLTMMKVSQAIKCGDGLTPSKSILKNDLTRSATRITKSVLFKDDLEEDIDDKLNSKTSVSLTSTDVNKENDSNEINLISFSPQTPTRRSRRLTKIK